MNTMKGALAERAAGVPGYVATRILRWLAMADSVSIMLQAIDQVSPTLRAIQGGLAGLKAAGDAIGGKGPAAMADQFNRARSQFSTGVEGMASEGARMAAGGAALSAPMIAGLAGASMAAIDMESHMADLNKAYGFDLGSAQANEASAQVRALSLELGQMPQGVAAIATEAGKLGVPFGQFADYTRLVTQAGVAFDMSAEQAGSGIATMTNVMGYMDASGRVNIQGLSKLGDTINYLADSGASAEKDIVSVLQRAGGSTRMFGMANESAAALAASFLNLGYPPEVVGTALNGMLPQLQNATQGSEKFKGALEQVGLPAEQFEQMVKKDATGAIMTLMDAVKASGDSSIMTRLFGTGSDASMMNSMLQNMDMFKRTMGSLDKVPADGMLATFEKRSQTTAAHLEKLKTSVFILGATFGSVMLPAINSIVQGLTPLVQGFASFGEAHPGIMRLIAGFMALAAGVGVVMAIVGGFGMWLGVVAGGFAAIPGFLAAAGAAISGLGGMFAAIAAIAGPALLPIIAIAAAVAAAAFLIVRNWSTIGPAISGALAPVGAVLGNLLSVAGGFFKGFAQGFMQGLAPLKAIFAGLGPPLMAAFQSIKAAAASVGQALMAVFQAIGQAISPALQALGMFGSGMAGAGAGAQGFGQMVGSALSGLVLILAQVIALAIRLGAALVQGAAGAISLFANLVGAIAGVAGAIAGLLGGAIAGFISLGSAIVSGVGNAIGFLAGAFGKVPALIGSVVSTIQGLLSGLFSGMPGGEGFTAIASTIGGAFSSIPGLIAGALGAAGGLLGGFVGRVAGAFEQIPAVLGGIVATVHGLLSSMFAGGGDGGGIGAIAGSIVGAFQQVPAALGSIASMVQGIISGMVGGLLATLGGLGSQIGALFAGAFSGAIAFIQQGLGMLQAGIMTVVTGIGSGLSAAFLAVLPVVQMFAPAIQVFLAGLMQIPAIAMQVGAMFGAAVTMIAAGVMQIVMFASQLMSAFMMAGAGASAFGGMAVGAVMRVVGSIAALIGRIPGVAAAFSAMASAAIGILNGMAGQAMAAGARIVQMLAAGIRSGVGAVTAAISSVAAAVRGALPHSPAEYGPLSDIDESGPGLINTLARGVGQSGPLVQSALGAMAQVAAAIASPIAGPQIQPAIGAPPPAWNDQPSVLRQPLAFSPSDPTPPQPQPGPAQQAIRLVYGKVPETPKLEPLKQVIRLVYGKVPETPKLEPVAQQAKDAKAKTDPVKPKAISAGLRPGDPLDLKSLQALKALAGGSKPKQPQQPQVPTTAPLDNGWQDNAIAAVGTWNSAAAGAVRTSQTWTDAGAKTAAAWTDAAAVTQGAWRSAIASINPAPPPPNPAPGSAQWRHQGLSKPPTIPGIDGSIGWSNMSALDAALSGPVPPAQRDVQRTQPNAPLAGQLPPLESMPWYQPTTPQPPAPLPPPAPVQQTWSDRPPVPLPPAAPQLNPLTQAVDLVRGAIPDVPILGDLVQRILPQTQSQGQPQLWRQPVAGAPMVDSVNPNKQIDSPSLNPLTQAVDLVRSAIPALPSLGSLTQMIGLERSPAPAVPTLPPVTQPTQWGQAPPLVPVQMPAPTIPEPVPPRIPPLTPAGGAAPASGGGMGTGSITVNLELNYNGAEGHGDLRTQLRQMLEEGGDLLERKLREFSAEGRRVSYS